VRGGRGGSEWQVEQQPPVYDEHADYYQHFPNQHTSGDANENQGMWFGATQNGMVAIANTNGIVVKWSETQIVVTVPEGFREGKYPSGRMTFKVTLVIPG
jgi:hypothetical protein